MSFILCLYFVERNDILYNVVLKHENKFTQESLLLKSAEGVSGVRKEQQIRTIPDGWDFHADAVSLSGKRMEV